MSDGTAWKTGANPLLAAARISQIKFQHNRKPNRDNRFNLILEYLPESILKTIRLFPRRTRVAESYSHYSSKPV